MTYKKVKIKGTMYIPTEYSLDTFIESLERDLADLYSLEIKEVELEIEEVFDKNGAVNFDEQLKIINKGIINVH